MEAITKLALAAVDLAEAELKSLQRGTLRLAMAIAFVVGGAVLALSGVFMLLWAGYWALANLIGATAALALIGVVFVAGGTVLLLMAWARVRGTTRKTSTLPQQPSSVTAEKKAEEAAEQKRRTEAEFLAGGPDRRPAPATATAEGAHNDPATIRIAS